ncbi:Dihydrodipicolinate synthetase [Candidatus Magnetomorum sp. HK-1]|nr:Dihydrodipicolinate synthetase [Candidatus Magnetomorum sp. HK-1]
MISSTQKKFLDKIKGPVFPIPTPFMEDGSIDYSCLKDYVKFLVKSGAKTLLVTVGTSRFNVLTIDEMKRVNHTVVESANGNCMVIVASPATGPTKQAIDLAKHAQSIGADGIIAVYPDRYYNDNNIFRYFENIANACNIGVLIHNHSITGGSVRAGTSIKLSPQFFERISEIDNIVGMKEETHDSQFIYEYNRILKNKFCIIGGAGVMRAFYVAHQWGQPAYLVGIGNFLPEIELSFYQKMQSNDYNAAKQIIFENEDQFLKIAVEVGWHLALKEAMAYKGLMPAWERSPMERLSDEDRKSVIQSMT